MGNKGARPLEEKSTGRIEPSTLHSEVTWAQERWQKRQQEPFQPSHSCDICHQVIKTPSRYHCSECANYDVCLSCYASMGPHENGEWHTFSLDTITPQQVHDALVSNPHLIGRLASSSEFILHSFADRRCFGWCTRAGTYRWMKFRFVLFCLLVRVFLTLQ
jgi:hypothetical protein